MIITATEKQIKTWGMGPLDSYSSSHDQRLPQHIPVVLGEARTAWACSYREEDREQCSLMGRKLHHRQGCVRCHGSEVREEEGTQPWVFCGPVAHTGYSGLCGRAALMS